ncbi:MAG: hypothetical protein ACLTDR_03035 [Adlercreutzia equolifaciens]
MNTNTQVLNVFGEVIPRLYAVGNMVGGFDGEGERRLRPAGARLDDASGRIASQRGDWSHLQ